MADRSAHQDRIIKRYYDHRDEIMLNRLGELVSELYLAEGESKVDRIWKRIATALDKLGTPHSVATHILETRDPEVLARNLKTWLNKGPSRKKGSGG